jgi:hypothetical protein
LAAGEEHVQERGFDEVVGMMAERNFVAPTSVQCGTHTAAKPQSERCLIGIEDVFDQLAVNVLVRIQPQASQIRR